LGRWREVELHHVDLGLGYTPADWPDEFVHLVLPEMIDGLARRADHRALLAWLSGRGRVPELGPWG
jgi:maleylpyruvate isomerase